MGISWHELQDTPAYVVQDYMLVMAAEANAKDAAAREAKRRR